MYQSIVSVPIPLSLLAAGIRVATTFADQPQLGRHHRVLDVGGRVAGEVQVLGQGSRVPVPDVEEVEARVHLEFGHLPEPEAEAEIREPVDGALEAGEREAAPELEIDAGLEQDRPGRDRVRVLGPERPLLSAENPGRDEARDRREDDHRYPVGRGHGAAR